MQGIRQRVVFVSYANRPIRRSVYAEMWRFNLVSELAAGFNLAAHHLSGFDNALSQSLESLFTHLTAPLDFVGQPRRGGMFIAAVGVNLLKLRQERHLRTADAAPLGLKKCSFGAAINIPPRWG